MFDGWAYRANEQDLTVMRVIVEGEQDGVPTRLRWDLLDLYDPATRTTSMSRTTAFPCAIVARLVARGAFDRPGVIPPEVIGREPGMLDEVLTALLERGVRYESQR